MLPSSTNAGKWNLTGIYHDFSAESGGGDFGTEFDASAGYKITDRYSLLLKGAFSQHADSAVLRRHQQVLANASQRATEIARFAGAVYSIANDSRGVSRRASN